MDCSANGINNKPKQTAYPIWAWYQFESTKKPRPDLRRSGLLSKGTKGVLLEINKNPASLLLSDFSMWHYVLSYKEYIGNSEKDINQFEKELAALFLKETPFEKLPQAIKLKIAASWEKIFDLNFDFNY